MLLKKERYQEPILNKLMIVLIGDSLSQCIQDTKGLKVLLLKMLLKIIERLWVGKKEIRRKIEEVRKKSGQLGRSLLTDLATSGVRGA